jgi:hypothetical protein
MLYIVALDPGDQTVNYVTFSGRNLYDAVVQVQVTGC